MPSVERFPVVASPKKTEITGRAALLTALGTLPGGRSRVALALVVGEEAPTYPEVAASLGIGVGTVYTHLRRLRDRHPEVYAALMAERARQLAKRHEEALARVEAH